MKRHGNLFKQVVSFENLYKAFLKAKRGKGWQKKVQVVEEDLSNKLLEIRKQLITGKYVTSSYKTKTIYEPKERLIYILPFYPDRIIHHAIMNVLEPIWDKLFIHDSYACRKNKGQHHGSRKCMQLVRKYKYCLQCDISKFYPSVNHKLLKALLRRKLKDNKLLNLLDQIIDSADGDTNVPIGNYLSQWFGNLYLNQLDSYVKQKLHVKGYIRYCDDFIFFSDNKILLKFIKQNIVSYLLSLELKISKAKVYPTSQGVDYLGYRHFPKKILCRKRTVKRMRKNMGSVMYLLYKGLLTKERAISKVASVHGWLKHAQTYHLRQSLGLETLKQKVLAFEYADAS